MADDCIMLGIDSVSKMYKLGEIGGTTLRDELQRWGARIRGKEDPTRRIDTKDHHRGEIFMALDGVSFDVRRGERVGIIGHNGAGKSTLLKLISRVTAPTSGTIGLNGRVASMLEVGTGFHPELTGRENAYMNGAILGMSKREIDAKMEDIIEFSECRQFIDTPVKRYSSGMYVKLAFSVAAHLDSEIMIMDEVLAVGDMTFQKKCLEKMNDVSRQNGRTILYVSHNMSTIRQLCERVIVLNHGQVAFDGGVEEGIKLYLGYVNGIDVKIDYRKQPQLRFAGGERLATTTAEYLSDSPTVVRGSSMMIRIGWENRLDIIDLCFRVEIRRPDRTPIGTAFLYDFYSGVAGESNMATIEIDTSCLVPGRYASTYTFFQRGGFGANANLDNVCGLDFEVVSDHEKMNWDVAHWGCVSLPDIKVSGRGVH